MTQRPAITGLILAGGQGSRMGGADKGLLLWHGKTLVENALTRLSPQVDRLAISANRNRSAYAKWGYPVLADRFPDFPGPLAGLHAGLAVCDTELLACVPCDTPNYPADLVAKMLATLRRHPHAPITWAVTAAGEHPVFLLCKKELAPALERYLVEGNRRVRSFLQESGGKPTRFDDEAAFDNLNTPDALGTQSQETR